MKHRNGFWMPDCEDHFSSDYWGPHLLTYQSVIRIVGSGLSRKGCAIDAGAHIGIATVHFSNYFDEVIAFEPCKENFNCLARNCEELENVKLMMMGLGNKEGKAILQSVQDNTGAGFIQGVEKRQYRPEDSVDGKKNKIRVTTVDSLKIDCSLMKIDVQGYERNVIEGAKQTIAKYKPILIIEMENGNDRIEGIKESRMIISELRELGYMEICSIKRDYIFAYCTEEERSVLRGKAVKLTRGAKKELMGILSKYQEK